MKRIMLAVLFLGLFIGVSFIGVSSASIITYSGEDTGLGDSSGLPLTSWPNASAQQAAFLSTLTGVGTENFESYSTGTSGPLAITFPGAGTATLEGNGYIATVAPGTTNGVGRYATSGSNYWESSDVFNIAFATPISAFGFYGIDIGDFGGQLTLTLTMTDGTTMLLTVPNTINGPGGGVLYYGFTDNTQSFTNISFGDTAPGVDYFGFDDMTIGTLQQINPNPTAPVPEPATLLLLGSGIFGLAGFRKKIKK